MLTPKIGTGRRLICGPNLVTNSARQEKISSEDSAEIPVVGSMFSFGKRTVCEDHVWFEDRWIVASLCDE
jgi:hypothetical protein